MKHLTLLLCAAGFAAVCVPNAIAENIVFQQAPTFDSYIYGYHSSNVAGSPNLNVTVYDNFSLTKTTTIDSIHWIGDVSRSGNNPTGFTITIFDTNNAGAPGRALYQQTITDDANQTFQSTSRDGLFAFDSYSATTSFEADANTEYWLSIVANVSNRQDWGWNISEAGNGASYFDSISGSGPSTYDEAFTLYDNAVDPTNPTTPTAATPEPGSLILTGTGLLSFAGAMRRKFAQR